ncbi:OB-fold domain-containing protein [Mumia sp. zg.B53]|uniref:Zn-ribbon domain-containing OB-fold protein n=1 Tax=unclassified Mumia TaxID=2621872 RepID=UPI001C6F0BFF|nr:MULTISPECIES: OB-fold domain-containing protein [unclassified Mumia]MBW9216124.1 OB-fold domain-containing protein [Mumia sp. zg.B53]MDD9348215.1 OB-fold domain-containing protein [Mumia sp.]
MSEQSHWVPAEVPPADEVTGPWWDATREHRLTVQECGECGHRQHPPRALCTGCSSTRSLRPVDTDGTAAVDSFTVVHRAPRPDVPVPYVVARVRLPEGPLLLTRLDGRDDPEAWTIGDTVTVAWTDLPDGRALPCFRPIDRNEESR